MAASNLSQQNQMKPGGPNYNNTAPLKPYMDDSEVVSDSDHVRQP